MSVLKKDETGIKQVCVPWKQSSVVQNQLGDSVAHQVNNVQRNHSVGDSHFFQVHITYFFPRWPDLDLKAGLFVRCREPVISGVGVASTWWGQNHETLTESCKPEQHFIFTVKSQHPLQRMSSMLWLMQHSLSSPCFEFSVYFPCGGNCLNQYRSWVINTTDFCTEQTASKKVLIMCFQLSMEYFSNLSWFCPELF